MTNQEALPPPVSPGWICGHCGADNLHTTGRLSCRICRYGKGRNPLPMLPKPAPQVVADDGDCGPTEVSPERLNNGRVNLRRERALERAARRSYDHDRD